MLDFLKRVFEIEKDNILFMNKLCAYLYRAEMKLTPVESSTENGKWEMDMTDGLFVCKYECAH